MAAAISFGRRGWPVNTAQLAALAIHPLDDSVAPSRRYEKFARKLARSTAKSLRSASAADADRIARTALATYRQAAIEQSQGHYNTRFDKALALEP